MVETLLARRQRSFWLQTLLIVSLAIGVWTLRADASILVSQLVFDLAVQAEGQQTYAFDVTNTGAVPENVSVTYFDWELDSQGNHSFLAPGSVERSLSEWITFSPTAFRLEPGSSQEVRLTVASPAGGAGSYWGLLMVESEDRPTEPGPGAVGIRIRTRFGVKVFQTVPSSERPNGRVARIHVLPATDSAPLTAALEFWNTGNVKIKPTGWFEFRNSRGQPMWRSDFQGTDVLPGGRTQLSKAYDGPSLEPGRYLVLGIVDYGGERLVAGQAVLTVD